MACTAAALQHSPAGPQGGSPGHCHTQEPRHQHPASAWPTAARIGCLAHSELACSPVVLEAADYATATYSTQPRAGPYSVQTGSLSSSCNTAGAWVAHVAMRARSGLPCLRLLPRWPLSQQAADRRSACHARPPDLDVSAVPELLRVRALPVAAVVHVLPVTVGEVRVGGVAGARVARVACQPVPARSRGMKGVESAPVAGLPPQLRSCLPSSTVSLCSLCCAHARAHAAAASKAHSGLPLVRTA